VSTLGSLHECGEAKADTCCKGNKRGNREDERECHHASVSPCAISQVEQRACLNRAADQDRNRDGKQHKRDGGVLLHAATVKAAAAKDC